MGNREVYDRNILQLLLQQIEQSNRDRYSVAKFIAVYVKGEMLLKDKLNDAVKVGVERRR